MANNEKKEKLTTMEIVGLVVIIGCYCLYFGVVFFLVGNPINASKPSNQVDCYSAFACECEKGAELCSCHYLDSDGIQHNDLKCPNNEINYEVYTN